MGKEFKDLRVTEWFTKREQAINYTHKAGFVHKDLPVTNPAILHISEETIKKLKRLGE